MHGKTIIVIFLWAFISGCVAKKTGQRVDGSPNAKVDLSNTDNSQTTIQPTTTLQPQLAYGITNNFPQPGRKDPDGEQTFNPKRVTFLVNKVAIEESNGRAIPLPIIQISTGDPLKIAVLNRTHLTLEDPLLGLYVSGARFTPSPESLWQTGSEEGEIWHVPPPYGIHPSNPDAEPASASGFPGLKADNLAPGKHEVIIRLQSKNKNEIIRKFFLEVK